MDEYIVSQYEGTTQYGGPEAWTVNDDNLAVKHGDFRARKRDEVRRFELEDGETFEEFLNSPRFPKFMRSIDSVAAAAPQMPFGSYYPRIYRKTLNQCISYEHQIPTYGKSLASLNVQLKILHRKLEEIYQFVEPTPSQIESAYGYESRNLLILACTEVESQFRLILEANEISPQGRFFTTRDFVKLSDVLRLKEYRLFDGRYPELTACSPYEDWDASRASESIPWYDAYNAVKHHREANFDKATIKHARDAIYACEILKVCQHNAETDLHLSPPSEDNIEPYVSAKTVSADGRCADWTKVHYRP